MTEFVFKEPGAPAWYPSWFDGLILLGPGIVAMVVVGRLSYKRLILGERAPFWDAWLVPGSLFLLYVVIAAAVLLVTILTLAAFLVPFFVLAGGGAFALVYGIIWGLILGWAIDKVVEAQVNVCRP